MTSLLFNLIGLMWHRSMWKLKTLSALLLAVMFVTLRLRFVSAVTPLNYLVSTVTGIGNILTVTVDPNTKRVYFSGGQANAVKMMDTDGTISILAGGGNGYADGTGTNAQFGSTLWQVSFCSYNGIGIMYVVDYNNNLVRSVTTAGVVKTIAGGGGLGTKAGFNNAVGTYALFTIPTGVACDPVNGDVWVVDEGNVVVRKIEYSTKMVSTVAGMQGSGGYVINGLGTYARFSYSMNHITHNPNNRCFYMTDRHNHVIRQITSSGMVTTFAGTAGVASILDGIGTFSIFDQPVGVAFDPTNGNIVVGANLNQRIRFIYPATAEVMTVAGNGVPASSNGMGTYAQVEIPVFLVMIYRSLEFFRHLILNAYFLIFKYEVTNLAFVSPSI